MTLIVFAIVLAASAAVLHLSVKIAAGESTRHVGFGTTLGVQATILVVSWLLGMLPIAGFVLSLVAWFLIVMNAYQLGFLKSLGVFVVNLFVTGGLMALLVAAFGLTAGGLSLIF